MSEHRAGCTCEQCWRDVGEIVPAPGFVEREQERERARAARELEASAPQRMADQIADLRRRAEAAEQARILEASQRQRERPRMAHEFDPGPVKPRWVREGAAEKPDRAELEKPARSEPAAPKRGVRSKRGRYRAREWRQPRKPRELPTAIASFARDRAWSPERAQALAVLTKRNDATLAGPRGAEATLGRMPLYSQAAVRRAMRARGWTLGDEAARRHVAFWATMETLARPRAYVRPQRWHGSKSGASRFRGLARYALCVVGWTQTALARALSGRSSTEGYSDPIDVKTVQRHTELAMACGALQRVVRCPDSDAQLRGPEGWPINQYWLPAADFRKPGFSGTWFDEDGNPIGLEDALALEFPARAKRARRERERRKSERPPPIAAS